MKKIIIAVVVLLTTATMAVAAASNDQLPKKAQEFIKSYFAQNKISYAKQDIGFFDGDYTVVFTDGKKVKFTKKGEWKEVKCKKSEVPSGITPQNIITFIKEKHPDQKIISIDKDSRDYELELSNGTELKFNLKGKFLGYDD